MTFDLYVWKGPRDVDAERADALIANWQALGGDPRESPFEPNTDVGWFYRELTKDEPELETSSDATLSRTSAPIWLSSSDEPTARVVGIRVTPDTHRDSIDAIFGLAAKYDLVLFDARSRRVHLPLEDMAAYASATFWPAGAIQAAVAGGIGAVIAIIAWFLGIPVVSGVLMLIGGFMFVMAVFTFIHEGRKGSTEGRKDSSSRRTIDPEDPDRSEG